jgi:hypothetical protein
MLGIRVVSDGSTTGLGFSAYFESVGMIPGGPGCPLLWTIEGGYIGPAVTVFNQTLSLDLSSMLTSSVYSHCDWVITPVPGFTVRVNFTRFDVSIALW